MGLPEPHFQQWRSIAQLRFYGEGSVILRQGARSKAVFVVRAGLIRLFHLEPGGKRTFVGLARQGAILGLTEAITGAPVHLSCEAVEDTELEYVERRRFIRFLFDLPELAIDLLVQLSEEFEKLLSTFCDTTAVPPRQRLLQTLSELADACGEPTEDGIRLRVPITVQDLADHLGFSRQWTSKLLQEMISQRLVLRSSHRLVLTPAAQARTQNT